MTDTKQTSKGDQPSEHAHRSLSCKVGVFFVAMALFLPILGFFVPMLGLPKGVAGALSGLMVTGSTEVCLVYGAIFGGKETARRLEDRIKAALGMKRVAMQIGRRRHRIGITALVISLVVPFICSYLHYTPFVHIPKRVILCVNVSADLLFVASFFILGAPFWEKVKNLFRWQPAKQTT